VRHCFADGRRKIGSTGKFYLIGIFVDSRFRPAYNNITTRGGCFSVQLLDARISLQIQRFYSERPHECQIGSGEEIRTAVRKTTQSRWIKSSEVSRKRFPLFAAFGLPSLTQVNTFWLVHAANRSWFVVPNSPIRH
jgi:hypothetical protein